VANGFYIKNSVAQGMLNGTGLAEALGASPLIKIYAGSYTPGTQDADSTISSPTLLATLTCAATPFSGFSSTGSAPTKGRATLGSVTSATAAATGTASYFDITTSGGTVVARGTVGTSSADLILNTTAITSGSTVAITSGTVDLPTGP
jgi:hypothetical protein